MYSEDIEKRMIRGIIYVICFILALIYKRIDTALLFAVLEIENTIKIEIYELKNYIDKKIADLVEKV